ncbi:MAG: ice-binding family protein [Mucilaginibacter sp.]
MPLVFLLTVLMAGCKKDNFKGEIKGVCSVVASTDPMDKAVDVVLNKVISVTFNTAMNPATINSTTFTIKQGSTIIAGTIAATANPAVFTFTPTALLSPFTVYTGTITTGAKDTLRTALVSNYVWTFTTIPQVVLSSNPIAGGVIVGAGTFAQGSVTTVNAVPNAGFTFTSWTNNGVVASTSPSYQFTITGNSTLVANFSAITPGNFGVNLSSNPASGGTTNGSGSHAAGSTVTVTASPNAGYAFINWTENGVTVSGSSSYTFQLNANRSLVANFKLISSSQFAVILSSNPAGGGTTAGGGTYNAGSSVTVTAIPNIGYTFTNWTDNGVIASTSASYTFALNANRTLVANFTNIVGIGPGQINLGTAGDFSILTKSGISTTGITSIGGNIGVSPSSSTAITGFGLIMDASGQFSHTPIVTGSVFAADYSAPTPAKMTTAVNDMQTAFTTANGLITPAPIVGLYAGDISGRILPPGLYKWSTGVLISNAGVTLTGGPNDTWVFQISQDLTVNNSAIITLAGGAQAKNIYWVVTGQATLGSNVDFSGDILSKTLISLNTGAKVTGKLLAQTAVTLNASTVVQP